MRLTLAVAALTALAACDLRPGPLPVPPAAEDSCGAAPRADLVGRDGTALERVLILRQVRVIRPGDAVTMDYRPERINFDIGGDGTIRRIWCG